MSEKELPLGDALDLLFGTQTEATPVTPEWTVELRLRVRALEAELDKAQARIAELETEVKTRFTLEQMFASIKRAFKHCECYIVDEKDECSQAVCPIIAALKKGEIK